MHREAEHPSSTHARKKNLDFDPGHDLEPRFRVKAYSTFIGQNKEFFFMHVLKKDVLLLCA
jgi:hypothetical protein